MADVTGVDLQKAFNGIAGVYDNQQAMGSLQQLGVGGWQSDWPFGVTYTSIKQQLDEARKERDVWKEVALLLINKVKA